MVETLSLWVPSVVTVLSVAEAKEWSEQRLKSLPAYSEFTSMSLFAGVRLRGDKRGRGEVIKHLLRRGVISVVGITRQNQESRNRGYAALWHTNPEWMWRREL